MAVSIPHRVWAFTPAYVTITGASSGNATVTVEGNSIVIPLHNGSARVMINRLIQLCFDDPKNIRSKTVSVSVSGGAEGSSSVVAIWGAVSYGDKAYQHVGDNGNRRIQYFVNFPLTVEGVAFSGGGIVSHVASVNERSFSLAGVTVTLVPRYETEGVYLRWIDRFGCVQYYLFWAGDVDIQPEPSSTEVDEFMQITDGIYAQQKRPINVPTKSTFKVCAVGIDLETLDYVKDIVGSPLVDMYIGDDKWQPVTIAAETYKYSAHHLTVAQDFEITVELPSDTTQSF